MGAVAAIVVIVVIAVLTTLIGHKSASTTGFVPPTPPAPTPPSTSTTASHSPGATSAAAIYRCTRVLGFSQTDQWYESGGFESHVDDLRWELLWHHGGRLREWLNPSGRTWSGNVVSPCSDQPPDRVVFNVAPDMRAQPRDVPALVADLDAVIAIIRLRFPSATTIVLQPLVGGPDDGLCDDGQGEPVNASAIHGLAQEAISGVVNGTDIVRGPDPEVADCGMYADETGHLTPSGAAYVGGIQGAYWDARGG